MSPLTLDIVLTIVLVIAMIGAAYLGLKATHKKPEEKLKNKK